MTNSDAIEYGKEQLEIFGGQHAEFIRMAIEALSNSQKQTDSLIRTSADSVSEADVIYRADAIDALMAWEEDSVWNDECLKHRGKSYAPSDVIKELPSAEPKTAENGSLDSEMPENKTDRTTGGKIYRQDAIAAVKRICWNCSNTICHNLINEMSAFPSAQPDKDMIHLQKEQAYMQGWEDGQNALREEMWEDERDRLN